MLVFYITISDLFVTDSITTCKRGDTAEDVYFSFMPSKFNTIYLGTVPATNAVYTKC